MHLQVDAEVLLFVLGPDFSDGRLTDDSGRCVSSVFFLQKLEDDGNSTPYHNCFMILNTFT